jgi:hypothetical protein
VLLISTVAQPLGVVSAASLPAILGVEGALPLGEAEAAGADVEVHEPHVTRACDAPVARHCGMVRGRALPRRRQQAAILLAARSFDARLVEGLAVPELAGHLLVLWSRPSQ